MLNLVNTEDLNIYFYEVYASNYNRYVVKVAKKLLIKIPSVKIFFIKEDYDKNNIENFTSNIYVINSKDVKAYCIRYKPKVFVNFGFRIPDLYWTLFFKTMKSITIHVQHGIYIDHFQRSVSSFYDDVGRRLSYVNYISRLFFSSNNKFTTLKASLSKDFKFNYKKQKVDKRIVSDIVMLWGDYWIDWYKNNLFYNDNVIYQICGGFDYDLLQPPHSFKGKEGSVTYICQSLIEDGRLSREIFDVFIEQLIKLVVTKDRIFYIKLHPRSNRLLYKKLEFYGNVIFCNEFPISDYYIGHYSTLLTLCHYLKKYILLVDFPDHPPPDIIKEISNKNIKYNEKIHFDSSSKTISKDINYYCKFLPNPYEIIADSILNHNCEQELV
jgi:hypothetical protein